MRPFVVFAILLLCAEGGFPIEMARIRERYGSRTSSTLAWVPSSYQQEPPANAVSVSPGGLLWCRGLQYSTWLSGAVVDRRCRLPFLSKVYILDQYELLVSVNGSARLTRSAWDMFEVLPLGVLMTPDNIMATATGASGQVLPGYVNEKERRAFLLDDKKVLREKSALLLLEDEPVRYEMTGVQLDEAKTNVALENATVALVSLENSGSSTQKIRKEVLYVHNSTQYWGHVQGTLVGLNTTVVYPDLALPSYILWGDYSVTSALKSLDVTYTLPSGSAVDVEVEAMERHLDAPYKARLTSVYSDNERASRTIEGFHKELHLVQVRAKFGQPYLLLNGTVLEGFSSRVEVLLEPTTTTALPPLAKEDEKPKSDSLATSSGTLEPPKNDIGTSQGVRSSVASALLWLFLGWAMM